jgi:hypothetical protein
MVEKFTAIMVSADMKGVHRTDPKECDRHNNVQE